jgi:hypothetical protein
MTNYDVFISYSRADNSNGEVTRFVDQLKSEFQSLYNLELRIFMDTEEIRAGEDWHSRLLESLRNSSSMIAFLSDNYLTREYCWLEWTIFERHSAVTRVVDSGIKPYAIVELPGLDSDVYDERREWMKGNRSWREILSPIQIMGKINTTGMDNRQVVKPMVSFIHNILPKRNAKDTILTECIDDSVRWLNDIKSRKLLAEQSGRYDFIAISPKFVGRVHELRSIRAALNGPQSLIVAATGSAGIGKTEVAIAYAHAFAWDYPGGCWYIAAEGKTELGKLLADAMHHALGVTLDQPLSSAKDGGFSYIRAALLKLPEAKRKVLIVLDNVDNSQLVSQSSISSLDIEAKYFHVLVTTRIALRATSDDPSVQRITIERMPVTDLVALLTGDLPLSNENRLAAERIVEKLDYLTLAVEIVGCYVKKKLEKKEPLANLDRHYDDPLTLLSETIKYHGNSESRYTETYENVICSILNRLSPEARWIALCVATFHPDTPVREWIRGVCISVCPSLAQNVMDKGRFDYELDSLVEASLVHQYENNGVIRMHRLVRSVVMQSGDTANQSTQNGNRISGVSVNALNAHVQSFIIQRLESAYTNPLSANEVDTLRSLVIQLPEDELTLTICKLAAETLQANHTVKECKVFTDYALRLLSKVDNIDESLKHAINFMQGDFHLKMGDWESANRLLDDAYKGYKKLFGDQDARTLECAMRVDEVKRHSLTGSLSMSMLAEAKSSISLRRQSERPTQSKENADEVIADKLILICKEQRISNDSRLIELMNELNKLGLRRTELINDKGKAEVSISGLKSELASKIRSVLQFDWMRNIARECDEVNSSFEMFVNEGGTAKLEKIAELERYVGLIRSDITLLRNDAELAINSAAEVSDILKTLSSRVTHSEDLYREIEQISERIVTTEELVRLVREKNHQLESDYKEIMSRANATLNVSEVPSNDGSLQLVSGVSDGLKHDTGRELELENRQTGEPAKTRAPSSVVNLANLVNVLESQYGPLNPKTLTRRAAYASVLRNSSLYSDALTQFELLVDAYSKSLGSGNRSTLKAREEVIRTLLLQGEQDSVRTMVDNLISDSCQYLGNSDVDTVDRYRLRLELYGGITDSGFSDVDFDELVQLSQLAYGGDHPKSLDAHQLLKNRLISTKQLDRAISCQLSMLDSYARLFGMHDKRSLTSLIDVIVLALKFNRLPDAQSYLAQLDSVLYGNHRSKIEDIHYFMLKSKQLSGIYLLREGNLQQGLADLRDAFTKGRSSTDIPDDLTLELQLQYGQALMSQRELERAQFIVRDVYTSRKKSMGADHPKAMIAFGVLAEILFHQGDFRKAHSYAKRSTRILEQSGLEYINDYHDNLALFTKLNDMLD